MRMSALRFEWDERKAIGNASKHGVSFEEARSRIIPNTKIASSSSA
jgi:uncharacterized DUF497 family protein